MKLWQPGDELKALLACAYLQATPLPVAISAEAGVGPLPLIPQARTLRAADL